MSVSVFFIKVFSKLSVSLLGEDLFAILCSLLFSSSLKSYLNIEFDRNEHSALMSIKLDNPDIFEMKDFLSNVFVIFELSVY